MCNDYTCQFIFGLWTGWHWGDDGQGKSLDTLIAVHVNFVLLQHPTIDPSLDNSICPVPLINSHIEGPEIMRIVGSGGGWMKKDCSQWNIQLTVWQPTATDKAIQCIVRHWASTACCCGDNQIRVLFVAHGLWLHLQLADNERWACAEATAMGSLQLEKWQIIIQRRAQMDDTMRRCQYRNEWYTHSWHRELCITIITMLTIINSPNDELQSTKTTTEFLPFVRPKRRDSRISQDKLPGN